uniref:Uncharacterized protein n=1 Tax=Opuntia streptacantha TaxID=393608 RepID=A0A7C9ENQ1_OPUST
MIPESMGTEGSPNLDLGLPLKVLVRRVKGDSEEGYLGGFPFGLGLDIEIAGDGHEILCKFCGPVWIDCSSVEGGIGIAIETSSDSVSGFLSSLLVEAIGRLVELF